MGNESSILVSTIQVNIDETIVGSIGVGMKLVSPFDYSALSIVKKSMNRYKLQ